MNETAAGQVADTLDGSVLPNLRALVNSTVGVLLDAGILAGGRCRMQSAGGWVGALH